jgi:hypothetical protein
MKLRYQNSEKSPEYSFPINDILILTKGLRGVAIFAKACFAGLSSTSYQQIDDTSARVKGQNHYTQIVCNSFYSAYFTTERKDRLTVLDVFRDFAPRQFLYNAEAISLLDSFKLAKKIRRASKIAAFS